MRLNWAAGSLTRASPSFLQGFDIAFLLAFAGTVVESSGSNSSSASGSIRRTVGLSVAVMILIVVSSPEKRPKNVAASFPFRSHAMSRSIFSYTRDQLISLSQTVIEHAMKSGATAADTEISEGIGQNVSVRQGEIETIEYNKDKGAGVTVYVGQRRGHASTSDLSEAALKSAVEKALTIARYTAEDEAAGLPDADKLAKNAPDLDLYHPWR